MEKMFGFEFGKKDDASAVSAGGDPHKRRVLGVQEKHAIKVEIDDEALKASPASDPLVAAIDQGTSSSRFVLFTRNGQIAASAQIETSQGFPAGVDKVSFAVTYLVGSRVYDHNEHMLILDPKCRSVGMSTTLLKFGTASYAAWTLFKRRWRRREYR